MTHGKAIWKECRSGQQRPLERIIKISERKRRKASLLILTWYGKRRKTYENIRDCCRSPSLELVRLSAHPNTERNPKPAPCSVWSVVTRVLPLSTRISISGFDIYKSAPKITHASRCRDTGEEARRLIKETRVLKRKPEEIYFLDVRGLEIFSFSFNQNQIRNITKSEIKVVKKVMWSVLGQLYVNKLETN